MCGFWRYRPHWPACASKEENNIMERKFWQVTPVQVGSIVLDRSGMTHYKGKRRADHRSNMVCSSHRRNT